MPTETTSTSTKKKGGGSGLKKKVGGLPLYVWLGVAVVGFGVGLYLRRRGGTAGPQTAAPVGVPTDQGSLTNGAAGGGVAPGSNGFDPSVFQDWLSQQLQPLQNAADWARGTIQQNEAGVAAATDQISQLQSEIDALVGGGGPVANVGSSGGSGASGTGKKRPGRTPKPKAKPAKKPPVRKQPAARRPPAKKRQPPTLRNRRTSRTGPAVGGRI